MNLKKILFLPNETLYGILMVEGKDHQTKNKKIGPFGQIFAKFSSLQLKICKVWQKITFIKNEPYYGSTKLAEGKGQQIYRYKFFLLAIFMK